MAFTNFYVDTGGADNAAGSVVNAAASITSTNGSWDITADTFIATGGTPFSGVAVGEWASIYVDGGAVTTYVAQVTGLHVLGLGVVLSTTQKYGTKPSASATARSCKIGGSWRSELVLAAGGLATTTVPVSTKINIKQATYTVVASRTISMAGATTTPLWFSGYNTTPGDLDADTTNTLSKPLWAANSTFTITFSGVHQFITSISFTGSVNGAMLTISGGGRVVRCRAENTNVVNSGVVALQISTNRATIAYTWTKCGTNGTASGVLNAGGTADRIIGCVAEGGGLAGFVSTAEASYINCIAFNNTGIGFTLGGSPASLLNCTVYNSTGDGIKWASTPLAGAQVIGCLLSNVGGYGINNGSGTNTNIVFRSCNDFYLCSSGNENGFGDSPAFFGQTEGSSPITSSTNMTPVAGSNALNHGFPGVFENQTYTSYLDIGAVMHLGSGFVPQVME